MATANQSLNGMSALITGGGGGIGGSAATLLARDGAAVTLMGRNAATLEAKKAQIEAAVPDARVAIITGSAMYDADMLRAVQTAVSHGGGLDIVIPTVGGAAAYSPVLELDADTFMATIAGNIRPAFLAVRQGVPAMTRGGSIVFVSSAAAEMPLTNISGYATAKAGLDHFMRCAAFELGPRGIRLNAVRPGLTRSAQTAPTFNDAAITSAYLAATPLRRLGEPIDTAGAIRFLAGPESSWITGQSLGIDGGNTLVGAVQMDLLAGEVSV